jgi:hypothetical protein
MFIAILSLAGFASAREPETVKVRVGQSKNADAGRLTINFISVVEDSRCPINARCVWAGNAKIKIAVSKGKAAARTVELNSSLKPDSITIYGYEIKFVDLSPHPGENVKMVAMPKMATLSVKKVR